MDIPVTSAVTFRLEHFEGPLDLLLHLLSKNKMEIKDIPVALILEQYIDYLAQMRRMDMEIASSFIVMAAELIYIKTKMLLPAPPEEDAEDPRASLVETLLEYRRFKESAALLRPLAERGRDLFIKPPEPQRDRPREYRHSPAELAAALRAAISRVHQKLPPPVSAFDGVVGREPVPVELKITEVMRLLSRHGSLAFRSVFAGAHSRSELVAVFLAVLELLNTKRIWPDESSGECILTMSGGDVPCA